MKKCVHLTVLRLLLVRYHLLLGLDDAAELGLVQRLEQKGFLFRVHTQVLLDVVFDWRPLGRIRIGRKERICHLVDVAII